MFYGNFDALLFGHTHKSYIELLSTKALAANINDKRKRGSFFKKVIPKWIIRRVENDCLVSYKRGKTKNGLYPKLKYYFEYRYLKSLNHDIKGPPHFKSPKDFHKYIDSFVADNKIKDEIDNLLKEKTLVSMAPSACQAEPKCNGLHKIYIGGNEEGATSFDWDRYEYQNGKFVKLENNKYLS